MAVHLIETVAHTTHDGLLQLDLDLGVPDADVTVTVRVVPAAPIDVDANGWPIGFFDNVAGSMPDLERPPQGDSEKRMPLA